MTPVLRFLAGVALKNPPTPAGSRILGTCERAARLFGTDVVVTCGAEGHPASDPHTIGEAFDVQTSTWTPDLVLGIFHWIQAELGPGFYIQYEAPPWSAIKGAVLAALVVRNPAATGEHFHIQRAKGTVYPPV